jgi:hypothetical protein
MYMSLSGSAAQAAALEAAFSQALAGTARDEFAATMADLKKRGKERNHIVHALWGVSDDYPDALINCPPDVMAIDLADELHLRAFLATKGLHTIPGEKRKLDGLSIYKADDFKSTANRIVATIKKLRGLVEIAQHYQDEVRRLFPAPSPMPQTAAASHPHLPPNPAEP